MFRTLRAAAITAALLASASVPASAATPINDPAPTTLPQSQGQAAPAKAFAHTTPPRNPFLGRAPDNNLHNDTWMTDAYQRRGPLGRDLQTSSSALPNALCGALGLDPANRILTVCPSIVNPVTARVVDSSTLDIGGTFETGTANQPGPGAYQNFTGGGYFFLDPQGRIWTAAKNNHVLVLQPSQDGSTLTKVRDFDLTGVLEPDQRVTSALPDFQGRLWFVTRVGGKVGVLDTKTGKARVLALGEEIQNSFAVDRDGVYVVSDTRMYRFGVRKGRPRVTWKVRYEDSGIRKPGQVDAGSGTTPTIMAGGYVAITDNADPMHVVVYRRAAKLRRGVRRVVCEVPVFGKGASATENSLITAGRSLFVENNHGYQDPFGPTAGAVTEPGFARVDVRKDGKGCRLAWTNDEVRAPTVVPKLSTATGLIYTYERVPAPDGEQPWFWTAIDARTGKTAWRRYAGSGLLFNNNYTGIAIGRDGSLLLSVIGGIVRLRDGA